MLKEVSGTNHKRSALIFAGCAAGAMLLTWVLAGGTDLAAAGRRALFILLFAIALWVTEIIPPYSVGLLVIALQVALLGDPSRGIYATSDRDWEQFIVVLGHPLIWLFFGGFVLAEGMARSGLDQRLAARMLGRFGDGASDVLLGVMVTTFVLSMFMSNTATTAMMLAIVAPVLATLRPEDTIGKGLLMGIAVAANLGGMGSLIGTPPNAIAVAAITEADPAHSVSFLGWLLIGLPPAAAGLALAWWQIPRLFGMSGRQLKLAVPVGAGASEEQREWQTIVAGTLAITILLWLTSGLHGIPTAAVSLLPIVVLTTTGVLDVHSIRGLSYDVLFLMAGGLALGHMVVSTGLSGWIVGRLPLAGAPQLVLIAVLTYATVVISNFMSNTAAANVLVPLGISVASGFEPAAAIAIAFGASSAMGLPVATPPNAMISATGRCHAPDFLRIGAWMGVAVPLVGIAWLWMIGRLLWR